MKYCKKCAQPDTRPKIKFDPISGCISEIGQKPKKIEDIQAQYRGLISFREEGLLAAKKLYDKEKSAYSEGKRYISKDRGLPDLYMTDLLG